VKPVGNTRSLLVVESLDGIKRRAQGGSARAQYELALCWYVPRLGAPLDTSQAFVWLEKAVKGGIARARALLASCYFNGEGVGKNEEKAVRMAKMVEENPLAKYILGVAYLVGEGGFQKSEATAAKLFAAAKEHLDVLARDANVSFSAQFSQTFLPADSLVWPGKLMRNWKNCFVGPCKGKCQSEVIAYNLIHQLLQKGSANRA
jgi:TPR repeat protein